MRNTNLSRYLFNTFFSIGALTRLIAIVALTAGFAYINRSYLFTELYEVGDFAANSLLIQYAKHLELLVGNYSRVGFNHPGPAILYVLAGGEWLFYDCLGWVKAPFAGQMIAEGAYSAFWIAMLGTLLLRMYRSISVASCALVLLLTATAYFDYNSFTGLWFPNLYYFPFATFTLALILVIGGRADSLLILAISCGFLIHGHVSFVAICGLMLTGALYANARSAKKDKIVPQVFTLAFVRNNRADFFAIGFVFLLFFAPLLIETIRRFPGPVADYLGFSKGNHHHSFGNALQFVAGYWNIHLTPVLIAIFALLLFARERNNAGGSQSAPNYDRPAAIVLLLATVALLLYAMYGIDDLNYNYIGLFYYAVPGFTVALIVASLMMPRSRATKAIVALIVAGAALPYTLRQAAIPTAYAPNYHDARIAPYFGQVKSLKNGVIALDLDNSKDWGPIWSTLLGIEIYAARHETEQLFCVNKNWHISFGVNARCTEQQLLQGNRYVVSTSTQFAESLHQSSAIDLGSIRFYKFHAPTLVQNQTLDVASNQTLYASSVLNKGWSIPDGNFVWSEGSNATLAVNIDPQLSPAQLKLDMSAFLPKPGSQQQVAVFINHIEAGNIHFDANNNRGVRAFKLLPGMVEKAGLISVEFRIREPLSPQSAGLGADPRMLGVALYSIGVGE